MTRETWHFSSDALSLADKFDLRRIRRNDDADAALARLITRRALPQASTEELEGLNESSWYDVWQSFAKALVSVRTQKRSRVRLGRSLGTR
jgi:hypothetical protein